MTNKDIGEYLSDSCADGCIIFENPDYADAFVGVSDNGRAIYNFNAMVDCLMKEDGLGYEDAVEFINFNTLRALPYMGDRAPIILFPMEDW